jgi:SDR family mycofactocin-dependent oxidoreductase
MGRVEGRVALVTGAARGQGRAEAVLLAAEGADIIAVDVCAEVLPLGYPPATPADLEETARLVEERGRRVVARRADVRDRAALAAAVDEGVAALGRLDVVVANAGICGWGRVWELTEEEWRGVIDTNLTGVWHTLKATVPLLIAQGTGGSVIVTSSVAGLKSLPFQAHYSAAKHGLVGLTKSAAIELGEHGIRVNSIHPWGVDTPMATEDRTARRVLGDNPQHAASFASILPLMLTGVDEIAELVVYLASDAARSVTGAQLAIDAGATAV